MFEMMIEDMVIYMGQSDCRDCGCIKIAQHYLEIMKSGNNAEIRMDLGIIPLKCMDRNYVLKM
jgi:hypothetical protein